MIDYITFGIDRHLQVHIYFPFFLDKELCKTVNVRNISRLQTTEHDARPGGQTRFQNPEDREFDSFRLKRRELDGSRLRWRKLGGFTLRRWELSVSRLRWKELVAGMKRARRIHATKCNAARDGQKRQEDPEN